MSVVASRSSTRSYSPRSSLGSSAFSLSGGMQVSSGFGGGRYGMAVASVGCRAPSVYGGAGGYDTRISKSSISMDWPNEMDICANEKQTMQNLNDRLSTYLNKVRSLEEANRKLELQIKQFYEKRSPALKNDLTRFYATITDLRDKIHAKSMENSALMLNLDNSRLAADDFKMKLETETNMRMTMEADVIRLKGVLDRFTLARGDLEMELEGLREELVYQKKNHKEEMQLIRTQQSGAVTVDIDCASQVDLVKVLEEMRAQYEGIVAKNKKEVVTWFETKVKDLQSQITTSTTEVKTSHSQVTELRRTFQSLEIELHGLLTQKSYLENNVVEVKERYSTQLSHLQLRINILEEEIRRLNVSIQQQASEYQILLDIKMRLEMEIAEYRRLLDGEGFSMQVEGAKKVLVVRKEEVVEEHSPHIQKRVRVIVEDMVDGKVVSTSVDEKVQEVN